MSCTKEINDSQDAIITEQQKITEFEDPVHCESPIGKLHNEILSYIFILRSYSEFSHSLWIPFARKASLYPVIISHVCSRWRCVALDTGELWSSFYLSRFRKNYDFNLMVYRRWISRAGNYPINVKLDLTKGVRKVLKDVVVPYRLHMLGITLSHRQLSNLFDLDLDIEKLAVTFTGHVGDTDFLVPSFFRRTRAVYFSDVKHWEISDILSTATCLPWRELRILECTYRDGVPFSLSLNALCQMPLLEECRLKITGLGSGRLKAITVPNLRLFQIELTDVHPDTVIPLILAPNVTTLRIQSPDAWSTGTYGIIKSQYNLGQLRQIELHPTLHFPLPVIEVLRNAPMIDDLSLGGKPVLDGETREKIACGQLGRFLRRLTLYGCDDAKEWLDMVEARQKNARAMLRTVTNQKEWLL